MQITVDTINIKLPVTDWDNIEKEYMEFSVNADYAKFKNLKQFLNDINNNILRLRKNES